MTRFMSNLFTTPVFCFYLSLKKSVALHSKKPGSSSLENILCLFRSFFFSFCIWPIGPGEYTVVVFLPITYHHLFEKAELLHLNEMESV